MGNGKVLQPLPRDRKCPGGEIAKRRLRLLCLLPALPQRRAAGRRRGADGDQARRREQIFDRIKQSAEAAEAAISLNNRKRF